MKKVITVLSVIGRLIVYFIGTIAFCETALDLLFPDAADVKIVD